MEGAMKTDKRLLAAAIAYFIILLAVPCYTIYNYYDILSTGETYKINVAAYDPYDPFRGRYVSIRPTLSGLGWHNGSIRLVKDENDFAIAVIDTDDKNISGYIKSNPKIERYYMNEKTAPLVENRQRIAVQEGDSIYVVVKVKNGNYAIDKLYINDIPAEEFVRK
jgi:uncharacterized membrane-anchored protein